MNRVPARLLSRRPRDVRSRLIHSTIPVAMVSLLTLSLAGGLAGSGAVVAAQSDAALPATAALVPEGALAYLSVDLEITNDQWAQTQELLTRVGYPDALPMLRDGILSEAGIVDSDGGVPTDDPLFGGELGVFVTDAAVERLIEAAGESGAFGPMGMGSAMAEPAVLDSTATPEAEASPEVNPADAAPLGVAAVFLPGDADAAWEMIQNLLASEGGGQSETIDYEGIEISFQADEFSPEMGTAVARVEDAILVAATPADLELVIDVANGDAPSIADSEALADVRSRLVDESLLFGFFDAALIGEALPEEVVDMIAAQNPQTADLGAAAFDFSGGFAFSADPLGFRFDAITVYPEDSPVLDMQVQNFDITADERVPANTLLFAATSLPEQDGAFDSVALSLIQLVNMGMGDGIASGPPTDPFAAMDPAYVDEQIGAASEVLGFDLRADFFDQIVGEVTLAVSLPGFTAGGIDFNAIGAVGLDDEAVVADSLSRVARLVDSSAQGEDPAALDVSTRNLDGNRIYVVRDPEAPEAFAAEFGVVGEELLIGAGSGIDDYVNGLSPALADDPAYQEVLATLPANNSAIFYLDLRQIVTLLETTGVVGGDFDGSLDADPACDRFDSTSEAQEAYDADPFENAVLDQDFDGKACDDFFTAGTPVPTVPTGSLSALRGFAAVSYVGEDANVIGSSLILYISEEEANT